MALPKMTKRIQTNKINKLVTCMVIIYTVIVRKQLFHIFPRKGSSRKSRSEMMKLACPPAASSARVCSGHFRAPIANLIANATSTMKY